MGEMGLLVSRSGSVVRNLTTESVSGVMVSVERRVMQRGVRAGLGEAAAAFECAGAEEDGAVLCDSASNLSGGRCVGCYLGRRDVAVGRDVGAGAGELLGEYACARWEVRGRRGGAVGAIGWVRGGLRLWLDSRLGDGWSRVGGLGSGCGKYPCLFRVRRFCGLGKRGVSRACWRSRDAWCSDGWCCLCGCADADGAFVE